MRQNLIVDGVGLDTFGVYISGQGVFNSPGKAYDFRTVPGRNGAVIGIEKRMENIEVEYPAFMYSNFAENMRALRSFLLSRNGYVTIEDTYHTDEYRIGAFSGPLDADVLKTNRAGQFSLVFNCKPQRFLKSGNQVITLTASGTVENPGAFPSKPLLRVYGTGALRIGNNGILIKDFYPYSYIDIDCDLGDAYYGAVNVNSYISTIQNDFPDLPAGENTLTLGSGITQVDITGRWWVV